MLCAGARETEFFRWETGPSRCENCEYQSPPIYMWERSEQQQNFKTECVLQHTSQKKKERRTQNILVPLTFGKQIDLAAFIGIFGLY